MTKIILLAGAPGTGKTTLSKMLHKKISDSAYLELSWLRCYHLNKTWSNASPREEAMSFENLIFIINNYIKHDYPLVIINDLEDDRVSEIPGLFPDSDLYIFSLFVNNDRELTSRVLTETRDSGYRNFRESIKWNRSLIERETLNHEYKIDNSGSDPEKTVNLILKRVFG